MKHRRKLFPLVALAACFGLIFTSALAQDPLKRGKGGGGGGSGGGGLGERRSDPPKRQDPPRQDPPRRQDPPKQDPPRRQDPPRTDPPRRQDPPSRGEDPLRRGGGSSGGSNSGGNSGGSSGGSVGGGSQGGSRGDFPTRGGNIDRDRDRQGGGGVISGPGVRPGSDGLLGKKSGRSGNVNYGSNSNIKRETRTGYSIEKAPIDIRRGSLGDQVRRSDEIRVGGTKIRYGYTHYNPRWCDDYFSYPYYVFDPYQSDFACSPWYYYPQLPPYFNSRRCYFPAAFVTWAPFYGVRYTWNQPSRSYWNRDYNDLDYVIDDIVSTFRDFDRRAANRLTPRSGQVGIIVDGRYAYGLRSDDFYDTLLDAAENTRTVDYRIMDIQYRRDTASVFAQHSFDDPWGRRISVYHYFKLEIEGRNWVIREFGTSNNRW